MSDTAALEAASYATWTADVSDIVEGWHVTATGGVTRRVNSARVIGEATVDAHTRHHLSEWFRRHDLPLIIRETPLMAEATSEAVRTRWAFEPLDETRVMTSKTRRGETGDVRAIPVTDHRFLVDLAELNGRSDLAAATLRRIYGRVSDRSIGVWIPGRAAAIAVKDGDRAAVFSVAVSPESRRTGLATQLMTAASTWAADQGVSELFVQVLGTNRSATELYEALGFTERYRYRYLQAPPDLGSA
ncbi:MAG: GNAT family N-acetyltransferase [Acidimicrobiia bacterium]|nr:MAG: GNAT family N-acetyltransferase [Acidimicrobiia bacterium]